ncbi:fatty acyl-CoA reductase 2-like [Herrania umbratica]|uniref:Fatty acyl-CoA reductase n=1 Tax=Herrania umbratica TaxID=108875 RepID=A0A6J1A564_9ROSI|nr:fatty acyl-CoA reductase 2-like [Herrania umbratica]
MEEKLCMKNSMGRESLSSKSPGRFLPAFVPENEKKLVAERKKTFANNAVAKKSKELGLQRAKEFGWTNAYVFTKAMGEMIIDPMRENTPVVIIRPPVVEGTCKEPFPGWIEGHKCGKGKLTGFPGNADNVIDIVPVDMVVNATLAAMVRHGVTRKVDINIYHVSSSMSNPLTSQDLFRLFCQHVMSPCIGANGKHINIQKLKIFASMEEFDAHLLREATTNSSDRNRRRKIETRKFMELPKHLVLLIVALRGMVVGFFCCRVHSPGRVFENPFLMLAAIGSALVVAAIGSALVVAANGSVLGFGRLLSNP